MSELPLPHRLYTSTWGKVALEGVDEHAGTARADDHLVTAVVVDITHLATCGHVVLIALVENYEALQLGAEQISEDEGSFARVHRHQVDHRINLNLIIFVICTQTQLLGNNFYQLVN